MFSLQGRCALITGASGLLGAHFARVLHAAGAHVVLAARRVEFAARSPLERRLAAVDVSTGEGGRS